MKKPEHTKPFNLEHAKAGAPFCRADGTEYDIVKWDRKHTQQLVGVSRQDAAIHTWRSDGTPPDNTRIESLVMTPLGYLDGKPVFAGDELIDDSAVFGEDQRFTVGPTMREGHFSHCAWPEQEEQYPETRMDAVELVEVHQRALNQSGPSGGRHGAVTAVANAALRHAIEAGQVVLPGGQMSDSDILDAFDQAQRKHQVQFSAKARTIFVETVKSLLVTEPEVEQLRADLKRESMELGKAERLLESLGYRSAGNGEWTPPKDRHFYGQVTGFCVQGDESSIKVVQDLAERGLARDMAVAEAVHQACIDKCSLNSVSHIRVRDDLKLASIIAKVQL